MPPRIIDSKQSQLEILQQLFDNLNKLFARFEHIGHYDCLRDYKGSEDFAEFGLDFWKRTDWVGISLWGPPIDGSTNPKNVLGFATYSPRSGVGRTAGALASDAQGVALYHDGRVFTRDGRDRPRQPVPMTEVNDRAYHKISSIKDRKFFEHVVNYHFSRLNSDLSAGTTRKGTGMDAGPSSGGVRSSATFAALHNPITIALWKEVEAIGYARRQCNVVSPDLLVEKHGKSILFEVKPSARSHDLILACGQVLVYNEDAKADRKVIVSARADFSGYGRGIASVMKKFDIGFVTYSKTDNGYTFKGLEKILPA